jgi:hypothetical protein
VIELKASQDIHLAAAGARLLDAREMALDGRNSPPTDTSPESSCGRRPPRMLLVSPSAGIPSDYGGDPAVRFEVGGDSRESAWERIGATSCR